MQTEPEEEGGNHVLNFSINEAMALEEKSHHLDPTPLGLWENSKILTYNQWPPGCWAATVADTRNLLGI